jgi:acetyl-CoA synthase
MSKIIAGAAIRGSHYYVGEAEKTVQRLLEGYGEGHKVELPETAYYLPMAHALMGINAKTVGDMRTILDHAQSLLSPEPSEHVWLPYLPALLDAGIATLLAQELITTAGYVDGSEPVDNWGGFITDTILRAVGIQLVDGRMPGFAAILGAAPDTETLVNIVRELQRRNILVFVCSSSNGTIGRDQLAEAGVEMGWDTYIVTLGPETHHGIYALNWAIRGALTFGGLKPGQGQKCLEYCRDRVFAFGLALGPVDDYKYALGAGAVNMGFPVIADTPIPEIRPSGITLYEAVVHELDHQKIVPTSIQVRGVRIKISEMPIPVLYGAAFEGERVRREQTYVEFGGNYSTAFEWLRMQDLEAIEDNKIEVVGPDIGDVPPPPEAAEPGQKVKIPALPLAIVVDVAGRKMQKDFEPVLERQIHYHCNGAMGIFHMGQRDMNWVRISKEAQKAGFTFRHLGDIIYARIHEEYGNIVDKVQVTIYTDQAKVEELLPRARQAYAERDARIAGMTDEAVDTFYSCTLCQSFAPNHVCIISPERLGLCGAYSWLDGKASYEINPTGHNQPVPKGAVIDAVKGQWAGANEVVKAKSNQTIERMNAYTMMDDPMTSCGCFECIVAIIPEANGVMVVNREYGGMTPAGMSFSTLAGTVGGGQQTPGFIGVGRQYLISKKFISADGGLPRIVWMPKDLKEAMREGLARRGEEIGMPDFVDKIADESKCTSAEELVNYLAEVGHPALSMDPMF